MRSTSPRDTGGSAQPRRPDPAGSASLRRFATLRWAVIAIQLAAVATSHAWLDVHLPWLAALGQLVAIFIVAQGLEFDVPIVPCVIIVTFSALLNLALQIAFNPMQRLEPAYAAALLAIHIVELGGLLYFTGGLQNPLSFLFLAPVLISATVLPIRLTIALGCLAVACASALFFYHLPLPWDGDDPTDHGQIFEFLRERLPAVRRKFVDRELIIHVSPGTPSMQTVLVLMGVTGFIDPPFSLVKSYRKEERNGRGAVVQVRLGIDSYYKAYRAARPSETSSEDAAVVWVTVSVMSTYIM